MYIKSTPSFFSKQPHQYYFVTCTGKQFIDGVDWVYCCTCDSHTSQLMTSLSTCINCNYSDFSEGFPKCIHIAAVVHMSSGIDAVHCLSPTHDFAGIIFTLNIPNVLA